MATVTSFEELDHPGKSELRQFAELFAPLFEASSEEARRQAVAALSRSQNVPSAVAFFIACQPIAIAAPFLSASPCLDDETLIAIARTQGVEHARAIVRRDNISPAVVDALVGLRHSRASTKSIGDPATKLQSQTDAPAPETAPAAAPADERLAREEALRSTIKHLARQQSPSLDDRLGLRTISPVQEALLVRFARAREADAFATTLADTLSASRWLAERIMLDISGHQLGTTLKGIGMPEREALFVLERLYNHLSEEIGGTTRSTILWEQLDDNECGRRVEAWRRADRYTYADRETLKPTAETKSAQGTTPAERVSFRRAR
ncbi:DUF2336 domain-containing protein [Rhizobium sp. SL86]|uniref:DUF2336 domain-containing protein n=1 Tax=Rhizobium sp. SL86 TaxID=2995148 RepID=UPI002274DD37|nr:DUF2336 domain-containing protein [Rhizobium sp. SL86]MCY1664204.1 DUF2336 domain-containing protein [Rhizobium sp. SL86]